MACAEFLLARLEVALQGAYIGCSIAVNGTCLTVTQFDSEAAAVVWALSFLELSSRLQPERSESDRFQLGKPQ